MCSRREETKMDRIRVFSYLQYCLTTDTNHVIVLVGV